MGDAEKDIEARMTEFEQLFNGDKLAEVATVFTSDTVVLPPGMGAQTGQEGQSQQAQNICITFTQCWTNVEDVGPTLYKWHTNALCLLGYCSAKQEGSNCLLEK